MSPTGQPSCSTSCSSCKPSIIYVGNDVYMWGMAKVFQKGLKYVGNDLDLWEMAQRCREMA